jgi:hypothetical protein
VTTAGAEQPRSDERFHEDDWINLAVLLAPGPTYRGLADIGEVLATVERASEGDRAATPSSLHCSGRQR